MPHKTLEKRREWYNRTKEARREQKRAWDANNKEKKKESNKKSYIKNKRKRLISTWKQRGLIHDDYDKLYDEYDKAWFCGICLTDFKNSFDKCMDHDHETGLFREFLCRSCNSQDHWKKVLEQY